jgi:hypothetical protein
MSIEGVRHSDLEPSALNFVGLDGDETVGRVHQHQNGSDARLGCSQVRRHGPERRGGPPERCGPEGRLGISGALARTADRMNDPRIHHYDPTTFLGGGGERRRRTGLSGSSSNGSEPSLGQKPSLCILR